MKRRQVNRKPLLLLLVLTLFSFFLVKYVSKFDFKKEKILLDVKKPAECTSCQVSEGIKENIYDEVSMNYVVLDKSQTIELTDSEMESVLGIKDVGCGVIDAENFLASKRFVCSTQGAGSMDFSKGSGKPGGKGVVVDKNTKITIKSISYPLALWLGQYTYVDSNKQIRKDSPEYPSNGQQIAPEIVARDLAPKEAIEFYDSISGTEKKPFEVQGKIKMDISNGVDLDIADGKYKIVNDPEEPGCVVNGVPCDPKLAVSDYNVGKSNYIASDEKYGGYLAAQAPRGDKKMIEDDSECLVEGRSFSEIKDGNVKACDSIVAHITGIFQKTFDLRTWERCTIGEAVETKDPVSGVTTYVRRPSGECIDPKTLSIKMPPIFGEPYVCEKELCANAFLTQSYRETLSPSESKGLQVSGNTKTSTMFFVATPCSLEIDNNQVDVLCLWDASPLLLNYRLQERDTAPNQEDFPKNFSSYWMSVQKSVTQSSEVYGLNIN